MQNIPWPYALAPADYIRSKSTVIPALPRGSARGTISLVSSVHGRLSRILLWIPVEVLGNEYWCKRFEELICSLPIHCEIVIVLNNEKNLKTTVQKWLRRARASTRHKLVLIPQDKIFSVWAQDPFVIVQGKKNMRILKPLGFKRYLDNTIAERIASKIGYKYNTQDIYFQGGNILVGDDFYLLGYDYLAESKDQRLLRVDNFEAEYKKFLDSNREGIVIKYLKNAVQPTVKPVPSSTDRRKRRIVDWTAPGKYQPIFHVDMFITLAGRNKKGKYKVFVGDPKLAAKILKSRVHPIAKQHIFESIIADLKATNKFEVIRMPLPLVSTTVPAAIARRNLEMTNLPAQVRQVLLYYFATYNNCLVEITKSSKHVWMPTYGHDGWRKLRAVDTAVERLWRKHGFTVHRLGNYHPFMLYQGGVHCLVKYLARG
jgi:hypothetical protein